jgi:hypothetical protein
MPRAGIRTHDPNNSAEKTFVRHLLTEAKYLRTFERYFSEVHPASCTMATEGPFLEAKRGRDVTLITHAHLVPRSRMSTSYTSSPPKRPMACCGTALLLFWKGNLNLTANNLFSNLNSSTTLFHFSPLQYRYLFPFKRRYSTTEMKFIGRTTCCIFWNVPQGHGHVLYDSECASCHKVWFYVTQTYWRRQEALKQ